MTVNQPTFAGAPLSMWQQLPKGVTVTFAGAGGQAPIIGLTDPASLQPKPTNNALQEQISLKGLPVNTGGGGDTLTLSNPLLANFKQNPTTMQNNGGTMPLPGVTPMNLQGEPEEDKGKGKGKGKGGPGGGGPPGLQKHGGLPPGQAKKLQQGKQIPLNNPWSNSLQTQGQGGTQTLPTGGAGNKPMQTPTTKPTPQSLQGMPGMPGPTMAVSPDPGPVLQMGPPFTA
jgi:hypothetical protein